MMLSHLCQARLWTRSERKAITGAITTDPSHQLKTWPVLNNAIGEICHTEVINGKRTKTDYFLYSKDNMSSAITVPFHSSPWSIKEDNGSTEESNQVFSVNCSYSQVSENPAYGLTPAWTGNMQSRYANDSSSSETKNSQEGEEYHIYGGISENENEIKVNEEATELHQKHTLELNRKYSLNSNKIEHIKHYLKTSSANHFNVKSKFCNVVEAAMANCEELTHNTQKEETRNKSSLINKEHASQVVCEEKKADANSTIIQNVHSLKDTCNYQGLRTINSPGKPKPQLDKLNCGSTFLSQANRTKNKIFKLSPQSNNLPTDNAPEQMPLWTESHLPSSNQNHRFNTYLNNDWYQLALPKYQKLPLQKTSTPSPIPSQKTSQNVEEILHKSSKRNPANISMVIMQSTYLKSNPRETSYTEKDSALPMGSLVAALYKESDWLYVQTPHGEKGFVAFSNCMALGTLTDEFFALTNVIDNLNNTKDSESSEEESDSEQLVSMEPLRETNYSKLAEVKANCGSNHQKNNMEEIFSMITKHGLGHLKFPSEKACDKDEPKPSDNNGFQLACQGKNKQRSYHETINGICNAKKDNTLVIYKNCFKNIDKPHISHENASNLQDFRVDDLGMDGNVISQQNETCSPQSDIDFDLAKNGDISFMKRKMDKLNLVDVYEKIDEVGGDKTLTTECHQGTGDSNSLTTYVDENKRIKETQITLSTSEDNTNTIPLDERSIDTNHNANINDQQKCGTLSDCSDGTSVKNNTNYKKNVIHLGEREKRMDDEFKNFCDEKEANCLKDEITCFPENPNCQKDSLDKKESITGSKRGLNKCKGNSSVLAIIENYSGKEEGTLSVRKGDLVTLLDVINSEWMWVATANGTEGYVPSVCTSQVGIF